MSLFELNTSHASQAYSNKHFEKFSEAAQVKYMTNDNNKVIICHFEFKISKFEKEKMITMTAIFKFYISVITKF